MARKYKGRKNVTVVKLFNQDWKYGKLNVTKGNRHHVVITGPDDKEYHVYDQDCNKLRLRHFDWDGYTTLFYNLGKTEVKLYILTHILDTGKGWHYNTKTKPEVGSNIKVIYKGNTVKWIKSFSGNWSDYVKPEIKSYPMGLNPEWIRNRDSDASQFIWEYREEHKEVEVWRLR